MSDSPEEFDNRGFVKGLLKFGGLLVALVVVCAVMVRLLKMIGI